MQTRNDSESTTISFGNLHNAVVDRVRGMILDNQIKPGEWLRLDDLATKFGVSTVPVREALRQLQAEGLVTFHPRRGAMVSRISAAEYEEIYSMREQLETLACRFAAEDFDRIPMERLKRLLEETEQAEINRDVPQRIRLVREYFFTIFQASQKEHLLRILSTLWDLSQQYRRYFSSVQDVSAQRLKHYRQVYEACQARDAEKLLSTLHDLHAFVKSNLIPRVREEENKLLAR